jgi:hypothetical protein
MAPGAAQAVTWDQLGKHSGAASDNTGCRYCTLEYVAKGVPRAIVDGEQECVLQAQLQAPCKLAPPDCARAPRRGDHRRLTAAGHAGGHAAKGQDRGRRRSRSLESLHPSTLSARASGARPHAACADRAVAPACAGLLSFACAVPIPDSAVYAPPQPRYESWRCLVHPTKLRFSVRAEVERGPSFE